MSPKQKCNQCWNVTKTKMSPKLKHHQSWNVTKTEMSPELKWNQSWNVTKTEMLPNLKCYQNWNFTKSKNVFKIKIKIQEIGPDYLDLVLIDCSAHTMCHVSPVTCLGHLLGTWHVTHDTWYRVNILSKFQLSSCTSLGVMMFWRFGGKWSVA